MYYTHINTYHESERSLSPLKWGSIDLRSQRLCCGEIVHQAGSVRFDSRQLMPRLAKLVYHLNH